MNLSCKNGLPVTYPDDDIPHVSRNSLTQPAFHIYFKTADSLPINDECT